MFPLLKENIKIAFGSIRTQLLRTILTVLIIGIGIMALVGILSAVSALESSLASNFSFMGANTFNIQQNELNIRIGSGRGAEREKVNPIINYNQVRAFEDEYRFPFSKTAVSFNGTRAAEIKFENKKTDPEVSVVGVNENFMDAGGWEIEDGRGFNSFDIENNNNVCVIGSDIYDDLLSDVNPVDQTI
uniref:ABC transporter permease n=1 Tax=Pricia sp. TaxID=2268138 RepID=UPI003593D35F